jgi:hypothetical protein
LPCCAAALLAVGRAAAYPWPVKPFYRQHPIRANFGDPRTVFLDSLLTNWRRRARHLSVATTGIDISAHDDAAVYPVVSGTARIISGERGRGSRREAAVRSSYFHLIPAIVNGQRVYAQRTVLGYIRTGRPRASDRDPRLSRL